MDIENKNCQICGNKLKSDDEIVVCPDCGAPYHRDCYLNQGSCIYKEKHKDGFDWKASGNEKQSNDSLKKICSRCGTENSIDVNYCKVCGYSDFVNTKTKEDVKKDTNTPFGVDGELPPLFNNLGFGNTKVITNIDLLGGVDPNEEIDGVLVADMASCVKVNNMYYMPKFKKMTESDSKLDLNWAALVFGPYWYLFRKNYLQGICSFLIMVVLYFVEIFEMTRIYEVLNITSDAWYTSQGTYILLDKLQKAENVEKILPFMLIYMAVFILLILNNIIWGVLANYLYRKNIISRIKSVNERVAEENLSIQEKLDLLEKKSGISILIPALAYVILQLVVLFV
jgi:ribosomal protein L40E